MLSKRYINDGIPALPLNSIQKQAKETVERKIKENVYTFEDIECPLCKTIDYDSLAEKDRYGLSVGTVICKNCGLLITTPRMTQTTQNCFYAENYRELYTGSKYAQYDFVNDQYKHGQKIANFITQHSNISTFDDILVLEVGCGAGGILKAFKDKGAEVIGLDLGEDYLEYGRKTHNLNLQKGSINEYKGKKPDILIYSHVLEHTVLPDEIINIKNVCHNDTLIYIEVPGLLSVHKHYGDFLLYLQNAHLYHFSLQTLTNLFSKYGFNLIYGNEDVKCLMRCGEGERFKNSYVDNLNYLQNIEKHRVVNKLKNRINLLKWKIKKKMFS